MAFYLFIYLLMFRLFDFVDTLQDINNTPYFEFLIMYILFPASRLAI